MGGATLGGGLGAGYVVAGHFLHQGAPAGASMEEDVMPAFSVETVAPVTIPIHVPSGNFAEIVKLAKESVVSIHVTATVTNFFGRSQETPGAGSGFIFAIDDSEVFIATNNHVIERAETVSISLDDEETVEARVIGRDRESDLALLSVPKSAMDALGVPYKAALIGDSSAMAVGDSVVAIGNAMGEGQTATSGIISAVNRQITVERRRFTVLQTDAAINQGNSGGPLVNINGEVIGINTAKLYASGVSVEGMGYSLPINEALEILNDLLDDGTAQIPFIGITYFEINENTKTLYNLPSLGIIIQNVAEGFPAHKAGLKPMDIVIAYDDTEIVTVEDFRDAIRASKVGDEIKLTLYRNNDLMEITVKVGNYNER
jgi:serine protease Do